MIQDINFMEVKSPTESKGFMDYCKLLSVVPGKVAFDPPTGGCPYQ